MLQRKRPQRIRFESVMTGHPLVMAYDGDIAWHINDLYEIDWPWQQGKQDAIAFRQEYDFATVADQSTFYEDFRQVGDVMLPFFTETQWYTRDRILEIEDVEVNADLEDALFAFPAPPGMERVASLTGEWDVTVEERQHPRQPWQESSRAARIRPLARGALLQEEFVTASGTQVVRQLSYDQFRQHYRLS